MRRLLLSIILITTYASRVDSADRWSRAPDGSVRVTPLAVPSELRNPWPDAWEEGFWKRANHVIRHTANGSGRYGTTWFESEKRSYGWAMLSVLGGYRDAGMRYLQAEDAAADRWNRHTLGIDYFPCFTLKQQMRKYFFFGEVMEPAYRKRMYDAARIFTEKDPLRRPHPAFAGESGWGPNAKNSWVDVRSTDNLKLMRDTSVYLLAEETGNEETRRLYRRHLTEFIVTMYRTGMGEWDSENYLGHSIAPLLNLYDFAKDAAVQRLAKSALDWMCASAAVKYWRGAWCGPTRRDYNHPYPFGGSAAAITWLWFGDSPGAPEHFESDEVHVITSAYRPPAAVVHLAHRRFPRPLELFSGKPQWAAWQNPTAESPSFQETQYYGETFQFGTLVRGTQAPDINGFKILAYSSERGADTIVAAPATDPLKLGSPMYESALLAPNSVVGQNGDVAIYLTAESHHPYLWLVPSSADVTTKNDVVFVRLEKTVVAIWPLNLSSLQVDAKLTERVQFRTKTSKKGPPRVEPRWSGSRVLSAARAGPGVYGFAIEIHEEDLDGFVARASRIRPEVEELGAHGICSLTGVGGRRVRVQWGPSRSALRIWRDGKLRDLASTENKASFHTLGERPFIHQPWQGDGTLHVAAGGETFSCTVARDGRVTFPATD